MIVLDANILIRAVLGRRVRQLVEIYSAQGFRFVAPEVAFDEAQKYLPPLLKKRGKADVEVRHLWSICARSLNRLIARSMANLKKKHESVCAVGMRQIGRDGNCTGIRL
jgi:predicted nucleic acid-binding protein